MFFYIRHTAGLGNAAIYARLRNTTGQFWDFVGLSWVSPQTNNCRTFLTERDDSDTANSLYAGTAARPTPNGTFITEIVLASNGSVLGYADSYVLDEMPDAVADATVEGSITLRQVQRLILALASKVSGGGTTTITFRDSADTKNRIVMVVDANGNRSVVTLDLT